MTMRRNFADRQELEDYLRAEFPDASGPLSPFPGGRAAAERQMAAFDDASYQATRNYLNGSVSRLSPYLRHGVLTLKEVKRKFRDAKFVQELAWRDYWQRIYFQIGKGVWEDRETSKVPQVYQSSLPSDWGSTGLACMDSFVQDLERTGSLHNHARMWVASYLVHWRRVAWQTGARWFLRHLLDGDPASNNLSWQWVASTFSAKPYIFNRENLERFTESRYCSSCPKRASCPFDKTYEQLDLELFR